MVITKRPPINHTCVINGNKGTQTLPAPIVVRWSASLSGIVYADIKPQRVEVRADGE